MADPDCDVSNGVCERVYMGFVDSSETRFTCGYYLMILCLMTVFFSLLIMVLNVTKHTSSTKIRYAFFMFLSKNGLKELAKTILGVRQDTSQTQSIHQEEDIENWVRMTLRFKYNQKGEVPIAAGKLKSLASKYLQPDKEKIRSMIDHQMIDNILCLENIRYQ